MAEEEEIERIFFRMFEMLVPLMLVGAVMTMISYMVPMLARLPELVKPPPKFSPLIADETEAHVIGTEYETAKAFHFSKFNYGMHEKLVIACELKSTHPEVDAYLGIFINKEPEPRKEFKTRMTYYVPLWGEIDIKDLLPGTHLVEIKFRSDRSDQASWNRLIEVYTMTPWRLI